MAERWWTAADDAELRLLCFRFAQAHYLHRELCDHCKEQGPYCAPMLAAVEAVLSWREDRILVNKAAWLRERERMNAA